MRSELSEGYFSLFSRRLLSIIVGTLRSDNGDVHENVAEKPCPWKRPLKLSRDYPKAPCYLKEGNLGGDRTRVQTEMVEFITLPFPFSSKLTLWPFYVVVVKGQQKNVQKSVMYVHSYCLLIKSIDFLGYRCHRRRSFVRSLLPFPKTESFITP